MRNKKLRMVDLLNLVEAGRYDEIPEGYKIECIDFHQRKMWTFFIKFLTILNMKGCGILF